MNEKRKTEIKPLGMRVYSLHAGDLAYLGGGGGAGAPQIKPISCGYLGNWGLNKKAGTYLERPMRGQHRK